ncbi:protein kinase [Cytophagaceae bacterium YF14B1]|uniref:Protein kinase n=1 Tax=Xanthocytophaga flava TaxID=3048013 RepID=A0AAE3QIB6_9BACT|nr:protein kinase [Xanthocytophaga flavus]MDJ1479877.1 protein kinase [Xanthocytophaga flavus]
MAILVKAPELPFTGGIVTWWEKETGQEVLFGDLLVEIRSGSTDYPVKAYLPGTLLHIFAKAGSEVQPEAPLALIGETNENIAEWLSLVPKTDTSQTQQHSFQSGFTQVNPEPSDTTTQQSGFSTSPSEPAPITSISKDPFSGSGSSGSSFTTNETPPPPVAQSYSSAEHLTTEQAQNQSLYGRGFDKFVKMRPVPQQGAMGELFFATQAISGRDVVIKRLKPERRADAKTREYFMREINLGTVLPYHRNIITILYSDENEFGPYYVMERINGHSLQHLIDSNQLLPERLKDIFLGILEGIRHIHAHWMVHRDLKPMNILIDTQIWLPKIIDFGFAKHPSYPDIDVFDMGTVGYMAPEQHGDQKDVTMLADIYAIGCVLYAMLSREQPHTIDLSKIADPVYAAIIQKCTQTDPKQRYASVQEIIDAVNKRIIPQEPVVVKNASVEESVSSTQNASLESFKVFLNEWATEALPTGQRLSKLTLKLIQKQAEAAGVDIEKLEPELNDFIELYEEIKASGELTAFKKRSLLVQGSLVYISAATIDRIFELSNIPVSTKYAIKTSGTFPVYTATSHSQQKTASSESVTPAQPISIPPPVTVSQQEEKGASIPPPVDSGFSTITNTTLYARAVGLFEAFEADKLTTFLQEDSLYEIHITTANTATFRIADNTVAQDVALKNKRFYLHPACVLAEVEPVLNQKIYTLQTGKLERSGNFWKIIEKAKIRIG